MVYLLMCCCCCCYHKGTYFQANHNSARHNRGYRGVVVATTKVHIFKQITTQSIAIMFGVLLLLLPQRYIFSSKSQHCQSLANFSKRCCCYHKGTYFQANHNKLSIRTTLYLVVVATTKVHIFKQITTILRVDVQQVQLLLLPQRYIFSSKSQHNLSQLCSVCCCCCYHKGTYFQANHNGESIRSNLSSVIVATTKVHIFKQITTYKPVSNSLQQLLLLPQRYIFSSKSQRS